MLKALANVAPRHLLDTRLNPPADLRAKAHVFGGVAQAFRPAADAAGLKPRATIELKSV
jgi:hypothetical protein